VTGAATAGRDMRERRMAEQNDFIEVFLMTGLQRV
jgi:hypothetical protein